MHQRKLLIINADDLGLSEHAIKGTFVDVALKVDDQVRILVEAVVHARKTRGVTAPILVSQLPHSLSLPGGRGTGMMGAAPDTVLWAAGDPNDMPLSYRLYDIVVHDRYGQVVAVVEVKGKHDISDENAIELAMQLWEGDTTLPPSVKYFLLLTPSRGYLWQVSGTFVNWHDPASFSMDQIVLRYGGLSTQRGLVHLSLAYLVRRWLSDLAMGRDGQPPELLALLKRTGFVDAIADGDVRLEETP